MLELERVSRRWVSRAGVARMRSLASRFELVSSWSSVIGADSVYARTPSKTSASLINPGVCNSMTLSRSDKPQRLAIEKASPSWPAEDEMGRSSTL